MTAEQKEFIEFDKDYNKLYLWLVAKLGKKAVTIQPGSNSMYVETSHFGIRLSLSFNETKYWISAGLRKNPTELEMMDRKSFRFFHSETVAAFFEKLLEVENFINNNEG